MHGIQKIEKTATFNTHCIRPFMRPGDSEPNSHYRPWLEVFVGQQDIDWNWRLESDIGNTMKIEFAEEAHAVLFELTWP